MPVSRSAGIAPATVSLSSREISETANGPSPTTSNSTRARSPRCSTSRSAALRAAWTDRADLPVVSRTRVADASSGQHDRSDKRPASTTESQPFEAARPRSTAARRAQLLDSRAAAWPGMWSPDRKNSCGASGSRTACSNTARAASTVDARRVAPTHDSKPRPRSARPASRPAAISPPAISASTATTGRGQVSANAHVEVVTPGAALPDTTAVITISFPAEGGAR